MLEIINSQLPYEQSTTPSSGTSSTIYFLTNNNSHDLDDFLLESKNTKGNKNNNNNNCRLEIKMSIRNSAVEDSENSVKHGMNNLVQVEDEEENETQTEIDASHNSSNSNKIIIKQNIQQVEKEPKQINSPTRTSSIIMSPTTSHNQNDDIEPPSAFLLHQERAIIRRANANYTNNANSQYSQHLMSPTLPNNIIPSSSPPSSSLASSSSQTVLLRRNSSSGSNVAFGPYGHEHYAKQTQQQQPAQQYVSSDIMISPVAQSSSKSVTTSSSPLATPINSISTPTILLKKNPSTHNSNNSINTTIEDEHETTEVEQMCSLQWNGYEDQVVNRLSKLYNTTQFTDVTLSCEGHLIKAHKVILAMCSTFFREMFEVTPCKHPLVIVNGMKLRDLQRVIQFIYIGQVGINQDEIDDFIDAAESLRIDSVISSTSTSSTTKTPTSTISMSASHSPSSNYYHDYRHHAGGDKDPEYNEHNMEHQPRIYSGEIGSRNLKQFKKLHLNEHEQLLLAKSEHHHRHHEQDQDQPHKQEHQHQRNEEKEFEEGEEKDEDKLVEDHQRVSKFRHLKYRYRAAAAAAAAEATSNIIGDDETLQLNKEIDYDSKNTKEPPHTSRKRNFSNTSSISSGNTASSNQVTIRKNDPENEFETISPPGSPKITPAHTNATTNSTASTTISIRLNDNDDDDDNNGASPVDMSIGGRYLSGQRLPPPPWYSPPSKLSSTNDQISPKSIIIATKDGIELMHEETNSPASTSGIEFSRSPIHLLERSNSSSHIAGTANRVSAHPHRHSLGHGYENPHGGSSSIGGVGYQSEEVIMKRSLSLSPVENKSYQLHLPDTAHRAGREAYVYSSSLSGRSNSHVHSPGDRPWMFPPSHALSKRTLTTSAHPHGSFNIPPQTSIQFHAYGGPRIDSTYLVPSTSTNNPHTSVSLSSPLSSSSSSSFVSAFRSSEGINELQSYNIRNYSSLMDNSLQRSMTTGLSSHAKYRMKAIGSSSGSSSLRMRLTGVSPSRPDSLSGSSTSSVASISGGGGQHSNHSSPLLQQHHHHQSMSNHSSSNSNMGIIMNHTLPSLTKPRTKAIRSCQVPQEFRYTAQEVDSMVEGVENYPGPLVPCAVCSKFVKRERLRAHIHECHLLQGEKIICQYCGIALKSKGSYRVHIWRHKRGNLPTKKFKPPIRKPTTK